MAVPFERCASLLLFAIALVAVSSPARSSASLCGRAVTTPDALDNATGATSASSCPRCAFRLTLHSKRKCFQECFQASTLELPARWLYSLPVQKPILFPVLSLVPSRLHLALVTFVFTTPPVNIDAQISVHMGSEEEGAYRNWMLWL